MSDTLVIGAVLAGVAGAFIACSVFVYYKFFFQVGEVRETRQVEVNVWGSDSRVPHWVDPAVYNGDQYSRDARGARPVSGRPGGPNVSRPASRHAASPPAPRPAAARPASRPASRPAQSEPQLQLPTDMGVPTAGFANALRRYYAAHVPHADEEMIAFAVGAYADSADGRADLDRQLQREHGQGLDEWFSGAAQGSAAHARTLMSPPRDSERGAPAAVAVPRPSAADDVPDARLVGVGAHGGDTTALRAELLVHGMESQFQTLMEAGIMSVEELCDADAEVLALLFPDAAERNALLNVARGAA